MFNARTDALVFEGKSHHCFTNANGRPIGLAKHFPTYDAILKALPTDHSPLFPLPYSLFTIHF